ncbi:MAG: cupredoxin domain-containing protein [Actinomycetota bacterium]
MYRWWVFVHLLGVFGLVLSHGVSVFALLRIRAESDPRRVAYLIELSGASMPAFYASLLFLLIGGVGAGFNGDWWDSGWIWTAIVLLFLTFGLMSAIAGPYFRKLGTVAASRADGSDAVSEEEFARLRRSSTGWTISAIGFGGFLLILILMFWKPSIPLIDSDSAAAPPAPAATAVPDDGAHAVNVSAQINTFIPGDLTAPADEPFNLVFDNRDSGVPHNVSISDDAGTTVFTGEVFNGVSTRTYRVPALQAGTYPFVCDVHPDMTGALTVG